jgi:hypothetical protein
MTREEFAGMLLVEAMADQIRNKRFDLTDLSPERVEIVKRLARNCYEVADIYRDSRTLGPTEKPVPEEGLSSSS